MNKKEQEIQRKLAELEKTVLTENTDLTLSQNASTSELLSKGSAGKAVSRDGEEVTRSDGAYFGGLALIALGLIMVFQQIRVAPSLMSMIFGGAGFIVIFVPMMIGIGIMLYDSRNKWGWIVTAGSCILMILAVLSSLSMNLVGMSLLQLIVLFLPFALGGGLLVKGMGGPKGVISAVKKNMPDKNT